MNESNSEEKIKAQRLISIIKDGKTLELKVLSLFQGKLIVEDRLSRKILELSYQQYKNQLRPPQLEKSQFVLIGEKGKEGSSGWMIKNIIEDQLILEHVGDDGIILKRKINKNDPNFIYFSPPLIKKLKDTNYRVDIDHIKETIVNDECLVQQIPVINTEKINFLKKIPQKEKAQSCSSYYRNDKNNGDDHWFSKTPINLKSSVGAVFKYYYDSSEKENHSYIAKIFQSKSERSIQAFEKEKDAWLSINSLIQKQKISSFIIPPLKGIYICNLKNGERKYIIISEYWEDKIEFNEENSKKIVSLIKELHLNDHVHGDIHRGNFVKKGEELASIDMIGPLSEEELKNKSIYFLLDWSRLFVLSNSFPKMKEEMGLALIDLFKKKKLPSLNAENMHCIQKKFIKNENPKMNNFGFIFFLEQECNIKIDFEKII